jgi:gamma-glutamyltranspeptidase/glutathione hydrolase
MNVLDFGLDPQESINVPHHMNRNGRTDLETPTTGITIDYDAEALAAELVARGYASPGIITLTSGLSMIQVKEVERGWHRRGHFKKRCLGETYLVGGADQRRDGTVGGR